MRTGATQSSPTANPDIRVTVGGDTYASITIGAEEARLISAREDEQIWGGDYHFYIDNSDGALSSKDYKGEAVAVYHGFVGETGSTIGSLWVDTQEFISREGKLVLHLSCFDIWGLLARVRDIEGGAYWNYPDQDPNELAKQTLPVTNEPIPNDMITKIGAHWDKTVLEIITSTILEAIQKTVNQNVDGDTSLTSQKPAISGVSPWELVVQAMAITKSYLLWKADNQFHVIQPEAHGVVYQYNLSNLFFSNADAEGVTIPNRVNYWFINKTASNPADWTWEKGIASDNDSYGKLNIWLDEHHNLERELWGALVSQADANSRATSRLAKLQLRRATGTLIAPMHCAQELFDAVSITDDRYTPPVTITGYVFGILREYNRGVYRITLSLGGMEKYYSEGTLRDIRVTEPPSPRAPLPKDVMEVLPQAIQGYYHDIHFGAYDWDSVLWGASTIKFYDGTTQAILEGYINLTDGLIHYIYFDLDDASPNVLKDTTDYLSVMTKKTGILCLIQRGSDTTINATVLPSYGKEPLITADRLFLAGLLDKLPDGTYGKVLSTAISAGNIKLSATVKDGKWYDEFGVAIDATKGIALYGGQVSLKTYPTLADYIADTNIQCYVGTDGKIYASSGTNLVGLGADGLVLLGSASLRSFVGVTEKGRIGSDTQGFHIYSLSGHPILLTGGGFNPIALLDGELYPSAGPGSLGKSDAKWPDIWCDNLHVTNPPWGTTGVRIDTGSAGPTGAGGTLTVYFDTPFTTPPKVFVQITGEDAATIHTITIVEVTTTYFYVRARTLYQDTGSSGGGSTGMGGSHTHLQSVTSVLTFSINDHEHGYFSASGLATSSAGLHSHTIPVHTHPMTVTWDTLNFDWVAIGG